MLNVHFHCPNGKHFITDGKALEASWALLVDVLYFNTSVFVHISHICVFVCLFLKLFKLPLEKEGQVGGPILAQEEIKTIFGCIPDIYEVHTRIKVACPQLNLLKPSSTK